MSVRGPSRHSSRLPRSVSRLLYKWSICHLSPGTSPPLHDLPGDTVVPLSTLSTGQLPGCIAVPSSTHGSIPGTAPNSCRAHVKLCVWLAWPSWARGAPLPACRKGQRIQSCLPAAGQPTPQAWPPCSACCTSSRAVAARERRSLALPPGTAWHVQPQACRETVGARCARAPPAAAWVSNIISVACRTGTSLSASLTLHGRCHLPRQSLNVLQGCCTRQAPKQLCLLGRLKRCQCSF